MNLDEVMSELENLGNENTKRVLTRHGAREPFFGVKIGDMKTLVKKIKSDHELALELFDTGNSDAMYLAGLIEDITCVTPEQMEDWVDKAYWYMLNEYIVGGLLAETPFAHDKALEWMSEGELRRKTAGWAAYSGLVSVAPDNELNLDEIRHLLFSIPDLMSALPEDGQAGRVKYNMNNFVISVGIYIDELREDALSAADILGRVTVDRGKTSCKVPVATDYINNAVEKGRTGKKRKRVIC